MSMSAKEYLQYLKSLKIYDYISIEGFAEDYLRYKVKEDKLVDGVKLLKWWGLMQNDLDDVCFDKTGFYNLPKIIDLYQQHLESDYEN